MADTLVARGSVIGPFTDLVRFGLTDHRRCSLTECNQTIRELHDYTDVDLPSHFRAGIPGYSPWISLWCFLVAWFGVTRFKGLWRTSKRSVTEFPFSLVLGFVGNL